MSRVFMYPGQGSQSVGMGKDFYEKFDSVKQKFDAANEILGRDLARLCFEGPEGDLKATQNTQPALFTLEASITDVLKDNGMQPSLTMGHSLGEYGALYGAGIVDFQDGLKLVARRGELMASAGEKAPGTMAAVIGLPKEKIAEVLSSVQEGVVVPANENTTEQTVISGEVSAVEKACDLLKQAGAKRAIVLPVSGAFHSPLMKCITDDFAQTLESVTFRDPVCPIVPNVTAQLETRPDEIKRLLIEQLTAPVRWVDSIRRIKTENHTAALEVGPGAVLQGLVRKIDREINVIPCSSVEKLYSLIEHR